MLMGRRTYDVVSKFEGDWPNGDTPILVATNRPLQPTRDTVQSSLDAELVDEVCLTLIPVVLGEGIPLFRGTLEIHRLELLSHRAIGSGMVELVYEP